VSRSGQRAQGGTSPLAGEVGRGGATHRSLARKLRAQPTAAETRLWRLLYPFRTGGYHFRKQMQVGTYVVDFACIGSGVIIEVDGDTHATDVMMTNDTLRDDYLRGRGFRVLRFTNLDVMRNGDGVLEVIASALTDRSAAPPSPTLPARGRVPESSEDLA
jgi:very-short-patch-repair endonuclease